VDGVRHYRESGYTAFCVGRITWFAKEIYQDIFRPEFALATGVIRVLYLVPTVEAV
jgi:hypothetical protein